MPKQVDVPLAWFIHSCFGNGGIRESLVRSITIEMVGALIIRQVGLGSVRIIDSSQG